MVNIINVVTASSIILTVVLLNEFNVLGDENKVDRHTHSVVCYIQRWFRYRTGDGFFNATSFDPKLCTHLVYYYVGLNHGTFKIQSLEPHVESNANEGGKDGFKSITKIKTRNPRLKTLVSIGLREEDSEGFSNMVNTAHTRSTFVDSVIEFLNKYEFDGLEVDWRYPTQGGRRPEDKQNFVALLKDLRAAFSRYDWILSVMLSRTADTTIYDVPQISGLVNFINLMTYDYHGYRDMRTGHNSPLYQRHDSNYGLANCNHTVQSFITLGADRRKINLGIPFYGRTFTLANISNYSVGALTTQDAPSWRLSQEIGLITYYELCREISSSWTVKRDPEQRVPYAFKNNTWISYDDATSITEKVQYVVNNYLSGVSVFAIDTDDITGSCHGIPMYLLTTVNSEFEKADNKTNADHAKQNQAQSIHFSLKTALILFGWILHVLK